MKSRTFTQLHASLYMEGRFKGQKDKAGYATGKDAKAKVKRMSKASSVVTKKRKS